MENASYRHLRLEFREDSNKLLTLVQQIFGTHIWDVSRRMMQATTNVPLSGNRQLATREPIFSCTAEAKAAKVLQLYSPDIQRTSRSIRVNSGRTGDSRRERRNQHNEPLQNVSEHVLLFLHGAGDGWGGGGGLQQDRRRQPVPRQSAEARAALDAWRRILGVDALLHRAVVAGTRAQGEPAPLPRLVWGRARSGDGSAGLRH